MTATPIDPALTIAVLLLGFVATPIARRLAFPDVLRPLLRRPFRAVVLVGLAAFAANALVTLLHGLPIPGVHDEFSYLLAADTFAHGRLTNPPHPFWRHFESWHILVQPSYQSKYPPAQGLVLAAGQVLFGHPVVGIWIGHGLACAALTWMLQAWVGRRWAVVGGLLAAFHGRMITEWGLGYWGGSVAMLGGALFFGGVRRIARRPRGTDAVLAALGLAILANSRPYEGLVASLPGLVVIAVRVVRLPAAVSLRRILLPATAVLAPVLLWMGYYNFRVTGDALRLPYSVWKETYSIRKTIAASAFFWVKPSPHVPREELPRLRRMARNQDLPNEVHQRTFEEQLREAAGKWRWQWLFYLGPLLSLPLILLLWLRERPWVLLALGVVAATQVALALQQNCGFPHYTAPAAPLLFYLVVAGLRWLGTRSLPSGPLLSLLVPAAFVCASAWYAAACWEPYTGRLWGVDRLRFQRQLEADGRRHLVIVRQGRTPPDEREYVYNGADIDGSRIVWARGQDTASDLALLDHFADRQVWVLDPDPIDAVHPYLIPWARPRK